MLKISFACFLLIVTSSSLWAQSLSNPQAATLAARACINHYVGKPEQNGFLLNAGFKQRGNKFVHRATNLGLSGHTDLVTVRMKKNDCEYFFGSDRNDRAAMDAFTNEFRKAGFQEMIVNSSRGSRPAFQIGNGLFKIYGSSGSSNGSYSTRISISAR